MELLNPRKECGSNVSTRLFRGSVVAIYKKFEKLCSALFVLFCFVLFFFRKHTLQFVLGSYAIANQCNNSFVLRQFSPACKSLPLSVVSILKPLLAVGSIEHVNVTISYKTNKEEVKCALKNLNVRKSNGWDVTAPPRQSLKELHHP